MGVYNHSVVLRRTSNAENAPLASASSASAPSAPAKPARQTIASTITREGHRTRVRTTAVDSRRVAEQRKRRSLTKSPPVQIQYQLPSADKEKKDVEMKDAPRPTITVVLPRRLEHPRHRPISMANVAAIEPELAELPIDYIQDKLAELGPSLVKVLRSVDVTPPAGALPRELAVLVQDMSSDMPTHMFAVYGRQVNQPRTRVIMYATHSIVWAANCAMLPALPPSRPAVPAAGERITIPVVPLRLPDPTSFPTLSSYLYTKRADRLLAALLPSPPPAEVQGSEALQQYAQTLARTHGAQALVPYMNTIRGLWQNVSSLGIEDTGLWAMIDLSWEILLNAVAISVGKPLAPLEPATPRAQL